MAYNTRPLKRAQDGVAPQYYNPTTDEYEALHGTAGANHVVIYGPDGQPASLATEAKLEAVRALLALLEGKDFATDTKAEAIRLLLASLDGKNFASETTLAALGTELELLKAELADVKTMLTDGTAKGEVTLSGTIVRDVLGYFSTSVAGGRQFFGATGPISPAGTLRPLDIRGFRKISIYFLNGSPTFGTRNKLRVTFHRTLDVQSPENAFAIAPQYEFDNVPANGSFRLLLTSDLSDLAGTPPDGLAIRYLPDLVGLVFSYDQASTGADGDKIILFSGVR